MNIPYSRWYSVIPKRRSRRLFDTRPIPQSLLKDLEAICAEFRPFSGARAAIVTDSPDAVFKGAIGHYGKIKGAPAFIAFIGDIQDPYVHEKVGYTGEGIILEATALGLGTCWVGGFFRPDAAALLAHIKENERVLAVTPVGYPEDRISFEEKIMTCFGRTHKRKPLRELIKGTDQEKLPDWIKLALEAARLAPSAVNRQPWRFQIKNTSITVLVDDLNDTYHIAKRLDCGIAMLHIETASLYSGVTGVWKFLIPPEVARFHKEEFSQHK